MGLCRATHAGHGDEFAIAGQCWALLIPVFQELVMAGSKVSAMRSPKLQPHVLAGFQAFLKVGGGPNFT